MSSLEDEIRGALRTEATRLREVRPLHLPPAAAHKELAGRGPRFRGAPGCPPGGARSRPWPPSCSSRPSW